MKKLFFLLAAVLPLMFAGCEPSGSGNGEPGTGSGEGPAGSAGKLLVSKMTVKVDYTETYDDDYDGTVETYTTKGDATVLLAYDEGKLAKLTANGSFDSDGEKVSGTAEATFAYRGNQIGVKFAGSSKSVYEEVKATAKYDLTMNAAKSVVSGAGKYSTVWIDDKDEYDVNLNYVYDNQNQLTEVMACYYDEWDNDNDTSWNIYQWQDGNIVRVGYAYSEDDYSKKEKTVRKDSRLNTPFVSGMVKARGEIDWEDDIRIEYSGHENKSNFNMAFVLKLLNTGPVDYSELLGAFGFLGKNCKNLPSVIYDGDEVWNSETGEWEYREYLAAKFEYSFNKEGLMTSVKLILQENKEAARIDFAY